MLFYYWSCTGVPASQEGGEKVSSKANPGCPLGSQDLPGTGTGKVDKSDKLKGEIRRNSN